MEEMALRQTRTPKIITSKYVITSPAAGAWHFYKADDDVLAMENPDGLEGIGVSYVMVFHISELYGDLLETDNGKIPSWWACEVHLEDEDCEHIRSIKTTPEFQEQQSELHEFRKFIWDTTEGSKDRR